MLSVSSVCVCDRHPLSGLRRGAGRRHAIAGRVAAQQAQTDRAADPRRVRAERWFTEHRVAVEHFLGACWHPDPPAGTRTVIADLRTRPLRHTAAATATSLGGHLRKTLVDEALSGMDIALTCAMLRRSYPTPQLTAMLDHHGPAKRVEMRRALAGARSWASRRRGGLAAFTLADSDELRAVLAADLAHQIQRKRGPVS